MAMIGQIKEVKIVDGRIEAVVETGTGQEVTANVMAGAGSEYHPLAGDTVLFHWVGQEVVVAAVIGADASANAGEALIFGRNASGVVVSSVHCKADGTVVTGFGADFVAMAAKVDLLWATLWGTFNTWAPVAQDGGAALKTAFLAAFPPPGPSSVASTNLKAD